MKHGFTARLLAAAFGVALFATGASAQNNWVTPGGSQASGIVDMCLNSSGQAVPISSNACANPVQVSGTFTASLGGFTPSASGARGTPLTVTTADTSGPLPTGAVDVVSNAGTTNPMYCNVNGVAATTSDQYIAPSGGWFSFTIPSGVTTLHCIATGGSTTANMVGGSGLPTGTGGGSGGGGGSSAITTWAGGSLGAMATYGTSPGAVLVPGMNAFVTNTVAVSNTGTFAVQATLQAGATTAIGKVDPNTIATWGLMAGTTPGTAPTNTAVIGGIYNSSAPTATTGQTLPLQTTAAGSLHTTVDNTNSNGAAAASASSPVTPSNNPVGSAAWAATQVSVASTATSILAARTGVAGTGRICATIENTTTTAIYLGGSGVTTSTGMLLPGIVGASDTVCTTAAIYGIVATGTATVTAQETF